MILDSGKAATFDCEKCDRPSQRLRNCNGKGKDALNLVNKTIYTQCPKALWLLARTERDLVRLYIECREMKVWPDSGTMIDQTAFTVDLFSYLDPLVAEWKKQRRADSEAEAAKIRAQIPMK